jgi:hypothetical protein
MQECIDSHAKFSQIRKMQQERRSEGVGYGKVLIAGGYLILEPGNRGLSLKFPAEINTKSYIFNISESFLLRKIHILVENKTFPKLSGEYFLELPQEQNIKLSEIGFSKKEEYDYMEIVAISHL